MAAYATAGTAPAPSPWRPRASTSTSMLGARPPMVRPATNTSTPATNGGAGPRRSAWPPATTMPTSTPSWKALVTQPYRRMPWRSSLMAGRIVMTARASKATRVMVRTSPMVSPRRAGVISPAGRLDRFMVGPRGHATGPRPQAAGHAGLTGNSRVWKGTAVVGHPPNPPIGPTALQVAREPRVVRLLLLVTPGPPREARQLAQRTRKRLQGPPPARPGRLALGRPPADGLPDRLSPAAGLGTAPGQRQAGRRAAVRSGPGRIGRSGARRRAAGLAGQRRTDPARPADPERGAPPVRPGRRPVDPDGVGPAPVVQRRPGPGGPAGQRLGGAGPLRAQRRGRPPGPDGLGHGPAPHPQPLLQRHRRRGAQGRLPVGDRAAGQRPRRHRGRWDRPAT